MDEFSLINTIKQKHYSQETLQRGIGDDAAVFRETMRDTVIAVDTFVEGIHFTNETVTPYQLGYRALAANFSDLAAMGAYPTYYLISIVVPEKWKKLNIIKIFNGMKELALPYGADLIGGDTVSGEQLVLSVTVLGKVEAGKARYRNSARNGDVVFVTGTLGDSQAGLYLLQRDVEAESREYFIQRHQAPTPRVDFGWELRLLNRITLNDVSDGIGNEIHEIAEESKVSIVLLDEASPVHSTFHQFPSELQRKWKYFGGEDFELVGTVSTDGWPLVQEAANKYQLPVTEIGYVMSPLEQPVYIKENYNLIPLKKEGYTHLK